MTDLLDIFEKRVLTNVRLTQHQMTVLAMILASPEGIAPDEDISKGPNLTSARTMLTKLGMITHDGDNKYSVSETGMKVAKDENLIDDMGELTELGNEKAYADDKKAPTVSAGPSGPDDMPAPDAFAQTSGEVGIPGPSESVKRKGTLLQEMQRLPDLSKKSDSELEQMMNAAERALETAPQDTTKESDAEELASHIEREIFKRANPRST